MGIMYIYELPFDINKELCRLLDMDDTWKELAGEHMKYSAYNILEIEQQAKRLSNSPTHQLFTRWGQLNHNVKELFVLLYIMKHVPALRCLLPVVNDEKYHKLLAKLESKNGSKVCNDENGNIRDVPKRDIGQSSSIPLPVMLMQSKEGQSESANGRSETSPSEASSTNDSRATTQNSKSNTPEDEIAKNASQLSMFSYDKLAAATDNWNPKNVLGKGGFGDVFKGDIICLPVAIKRLNEVNKEQNRELISEMCLNQYRHDNILPLYGYSIGGPKTCLIYQLMTGGSLQQRIHRKDLNQIPPLTWPQRYRIALGVANGLVYLHNKDNNKPLIHGDIKPANILLDQCLMPKIGDFGLARRGLYGDDRTHLKVSKAIGTTFYLPREYRKAYVLSRELDTYSYGVVLLEMASGRHPVRKRADSDQLIHITSDVLALQNQNQDLAVLEDICLKGTLNSNPALCRELMRIGLICTKDRRQDRPPMLDVYRWLQGITLEFPGKHYS